MTYELIMPRHTHRAKGEGQDRCWTHCVTPPECAANPGRQRAHGNIIRIDTCSCGATRSSEINAGTTNYGPWSTGEAARNQRAKEKRV